MQACCAMFTRHRRPVLPDEIGYAEGGLEFHMAVQRGHVAGGDSLTMPAVRIVRSDDAGVAKHHGAGRRRHRSRFHAGQPAVGIGRESHAVESVGIAHPLVDLVRQAVLATLIERAADHFIMQSVMIERTVDAIEQPGLSGIEVLVGPTGPDVPVHAVQAEQRRARIAPEQPIVGIRQVGLQRYAALSQLRNTTGVLNSLFGFRQRGQEHGREDGDDGDDDKQFDEGKSDPTFRGGVALKA